MWKKLVKKALLTGVCAGSLLWPYEAESAPRSYDRRIGKTPSQKNPFQSRKSVPTRAARPRPAQQTPKLPEVPPEQKLSHFKQQILKKSASEMSAEQKRIFLEMFDMLASVPRGRWIIENAPSDLKLNISHDKKTIGGSYAGLRGLFISQENLRLVSTAPNEEKRRNELIAATSLLAHEMTHSIQTKLGIQIAPGASFENRFKIFKLNELHAHLEEATVTYQLNPKTDHFYGLLFDSKIKEGLSPKEAEKITRTFYVKKFWENTPSVPVRANGENIYLSHEQTRTWTSIYDFFSYFNAIWGRKGKADSSPPVQWHFEKYVDLMDIDLKGDFFSQITPFHATEERFVGYMDNLKSRELENLDVGILSKTYINGILVSIRNIHPSNRATDGLKKVSLETGGSISYPVKNKKITGSYQEFDASGEQILEIPMVNNLAEGTGWQKVNGEIKKISFKKGTSFDYLRGKIKYQDKLRD